MKKNSSYGRRRFLKQSALAGAGVVASIASHTNVQAQSSKGKTTPVKTIDIHTHISSYMLGGGLSTEKLLEWMDAHEIEQAVVLPLISPESWKITVATDWVLEKTKDYRDRLIPFCSIDPRTVINEKEIRQLMEEYIKLGAKGFGEHKCGVAFDDPRNIQLYKIAGELGLPVLFHIDSIRNTDEPGLPGLEKSLQACPITHFIGHAQGWWASISGDVTKKEMDRYPRGPVAPGGAIDRLMDKYPNIHGDISAGSGANAFRRDMKFAREFFLRRADRLLFGSDYLKEGQTIPQFDLLRDLNLPADVEKKVRRTNAEKLLAQNS